VIEMNLGLSLAVGASLGALIVAAAGLFGWSEETTTWVAFGTATVTLPIYLLVADRHRPSEASAKHRAESRTT